MFLRGMKVDVKQQKFFTMNDKQYRTAGKF